MRQSKPAKLSSSQSPNTESNTEIESMSAVNQIFQSIRMPRVFRSVESMQIFGLLLAIIGLGLYMNSTYPRFWTEINREIMLLNFIFEAIIAIGMTIVIITGGIDLSVAAVVPFSAIIVGKLLNDDVSVPLAIALALGASAAIGFINAAMFKPFPCTSLYRDARDTVDTARCQSGHY